MKLHLAIVPALALAGALGAGAAQARDADVSWSVTIGSPNVYARPAPVLVAPPPVVYHRPAPVMVVPQPVYYREPTHWDRDGDGIPNRYDRVYNPVWDRDGDGIPNRYERRAHPYRGYGDHDRDGVPNRWDRYDHNPWRR
jgi:PXPV repeat (3 copies)